MPAIFPALIPEELVYSAIARYAARMRFASEGAVLRTVFGKDTATAVIDLPTRLGALVDRLPSGHPYDVKQLVYGHTTYPYYRWFLPVSRAERAEQVLRDGGRDTVPAGLGLRASSVPTPFFLRFCARCFEADTALYGAAAWKRSHQLPGVTVCPEHGTPLCDSPYARGNRLHRKSFHALDESAFPRREVQPGMPDAHEAVLRAIAEDSLWLLTHRGTAPAADLLQRYRAEAAATGYATAAGYVRIRELRPALEDHYGRAFLQQLGCETASGDDWLARLLRVSRNGAHPLQHILLARFLGRPIGEMLSPAPSGPPQEPSPSPEPPRRPRGKGLGTPSIEWEERLRRLVADEGVTLSRIAEELGVGRLTVQQHAKRLGVWRDGWKMGTWDTVEGHVLNRRVLAIEAGHAALIDIDSKKAVPEWESVEDIRQAMEEGRARVLTADPNPADLRQNAELPDGIRRMRDRRWNAIQPLVEPAGNGSPLDILNPETRGRLVAGAELSGHGKGSVYTWLRLYWQRGQTVNALLPAYEKAPGVDRLERKAAGGEKRGRKSRWELDGHPGLSVTEDVRRLLVRGGKLFYARKYRGRRLSLAQAYHRVLDMFFTERVEAAPDGTLVHVRYDALPTLRQFKYWFGKARRIEKELKDRYSSRRVALRNRPVLGSSEHLSRGPGDLYLIDATVGDIYLVSSFDRGRWVIGRPVIYLVVDHWSRMIVGLYVGLEGPSWLGAMMALECAFGDKVAFCARYGVEISPEEWPVTGMPGSITADRGEMIGEPADNLVEAFGTTIFNTPPFRADFKSYVEGLFRILNEKGIKRQPGWVDKLKDRGDPDYRLDARYTLNEFTKLMIHLALHYNWHRRLEKQIPREYPLERDTNPTPQELWEWGVEHRQVLLGSMDQERMRINLLPLARGIATPNGLRVHGRVYYTCPRALEEGWFLKGTGRKRKNVVVAYDPRDVSTVYLRSDQGRTIEPCELTPASKIRFSGKTLDEVLDDGDREEIRKAGDVHSTRIPERDLNRFLEEFEEEVTTAREAALGAGGQPVTGAIRESRDEEKRARRAEESFVRPEHPALAETVEDEEIVLFPD